MDRASLKDMILRQMRRRQAQQPRGGMRPQEMYTPPEPHHGMGAKIKPQPTGPVRRPPDIDYKPPDIYYKPPAESRPQPARPVGNPVAPSTGFPQGESPVFSDGSARPIPMPSPAMPQPGYLPQDRQFSQPLSPQRAQALTELLKLLMGRFR
jgi:hypothetical protein